MGSNATYSVPQEARKVFEDDILGNPLMSNLPSNLKSLSEYVRFEGCDKPSGPINWRFAESISSLKALEATMLNALLVKKYKISPVKVTINT